MNESDYQHNLRALRMALAEQAMTFPMLPGLFYRCAFDFLLLHGREYRPVAWRGQYKQGVPKECYGNAIALAGQYGLKYVEGVALAPSGSAILHSWNATDAGELVDCTWCNTGMVYLGVEFSVERADDATWNGDSHVLNDEKHGYPVFQKPWEGEDYTRQYPFSDRLEALRVWRETGIYHSPKSVEEWLEGQPKAEGTIDPSRTPTM